MKRVIVFALLLIAGMPTSEAQTAYPAKSIRFIAPFATGGGTDLIARTLAQKLSEGFGHAVYVDNRPGGSGVIGTELTVKAPPDGYTMMIATPTITVNPSFMPNLPYDALRDLQAVSLLASSPHLLAVHPSLPVKRVQELVALARARPRQLAFSGITGGSSHLSAELFASRAKIEMLHVPYKSTGQNVMAIVSGEVSLGFNDIMTNLPQMKAGRLRALAITSLQRSAVLPDVPTIDESGYRGFESGVWYGVVVPARTPAEIVARLNAEILKVARQPDFVQRLAAQGAQIVGSTPEQFGAHLGAETARWARIIKAANIRRE